MNSDQGKLKLDGKLTKYSEVAREKFQTNRGMKPLTEKNWQISHIEHTTDESRATRFR